MTDIENLCERVQVLSLNRTKRWDRKQLREIMRRSPVFERHIHRLWIYKDYIWNIVPREADGFDDVEVSFLIDNLGLQADKIHKQMNAEDLSRHCSALWYFQVVPSRFNVAWHLTGTANLVPSPALTLVSGGSEALDQNNSTRWCWNYQQDHPSQETSLKLANIALVLDWRDMFKKEIKTVIWNWTENTMAGTITPVECLQERSLNNRKQQEMKKIMDWFIDITEKPNLPEQVDKHLRNNPIKLRDPSQSASGNIYSWIKSLQAELLSPPPSTAQVGQNDSRRRETQLSAVSQNTTTTKSHYRGGYQPRRHDSFLRRWAVTISGTTECRDFVIDMFNRAHSFIESRQREITEEMMAWRDAQVAGWEKILEEIELGELPNGAAQPNTEARS